MSRVLPILFNTEMVRAILDGRKTVTRRTVKYKYDNTELRIKQDKYGTSLIEIQKDIEGETHGKNPDGSTWHRLRPYIEKQPPYRPGDILYVRETWAFVPCIECSMGELISVRCREDPVIYDDGDSISEGCFVYKASHSEPRRISWRPSIHMPRQAARIWLRVTDVRAGRLQEMKLDDFLREGVSVMPEAFNDPENAFLQARGDFRQIWDSTLKRGSYAMYGWDANPWAWVIEFEKCGKPESEG